jgi:hypothetical protein
MTLRPLRALLVGAALVAGCTTPTDYPATPAYSRYQVEDVIAMSKAGEPDGVILDKLRAANAFFPLTASEIVKLHGEGVSLAVLDYMQKTYLRGVRMEERFQLPSRFSSKY